MDKKYLIGAGAIVVVIGLIIALYATYPQVVECNDDTDCGYYETCKNGLCV